MSGFSVDWLSLREPYDRSARNSTVLDAVANAFVDQATIAIVDLACGTGSTLRAIGAHLPPRQAWRLVDNDLSLLARASTLGEAPHLTVVAKPVDLARDLEHALEGPLDLVTTSALLDLVSAQWLDRLIIEAAARRLPVYAALSYDGRTTVEPEERPDGEILAGFNVHQRTDKGFGPALGPSAAARAVERFEHFGFAVAQGRSDWIFEPDDRAMQNALFGGWAEVAAVTTTLTSDQIAHWLAARREHLAAGRSRLRVGHVDLFARPIGTR
jgi:SAM-dependent methyltransferase